MSEDVVVARYSCWITMVFSRPADYKQRDALSTAAQCLSGGAATKEGV